MYIYIYIYVYIYVCVCVCQRACRCHLILDTTLCGVSVSFFRVQRTVQVTVHTSFTLQVYRTLSSIFLQKILVAFFEHELDTVKDTYLGYRYAHSSGSGTIQYTRHIAINTHTATHCNTSQRTATHCNRVQQHTHCLAFCCPRVLHTFPYVHAHTHTHTLSHTFIHIQTRLVVSFRMSLDALQVHARTQTHTYTHTHTHTCHRICFLWTRTIGWAVIQM